VPVIRGDERKKYVIGSRDIGITIGKVVSKRAQPNLYIHADDEQGQARTVPSLDRVWSVEPRVAAPPSVLW
jgi:hypothetical protein